MKEFVALIDVIPDDTDVDFEQFVGNLKKVLPVQLVNLLENPIKSLKVDNEKTFSFESNPQEILTFHVILRK